MIIPSAAPSASERAQRWPPLPREDWTATRETLHLWTQVIGKLTVELAPFQNHLWQTGLHLTAHGLSTGPLPCGPDVIEAAFDFREHQLRIVSSNGKRVDLPLVPRSVADFYAEVMAALASVGCQVAINPKAQELPESVQLDQDFSHASYDPDPVQRWWRILTSTAEVAERHRQYYTGKTSGVLFYWGGFDLAIARYNGVPCDPPQNGGYIFRVAESETNWTAGFWPGSGKADYSAFYAYAYPQPEGITAAEVRPAAAFWSADMREFLLPYDAVRTADDPDQALLEFFQSTYEAAATYGKWDRERLELREIPRPR